MTRKLRPCGTQSAYRRHLNRGEVPCAECRAANTARTNPGSPSALRVGEQEWSVVLDADPPVIEWVKNSRGIFVAASVRDPHAETKAAREWDARMAREEETLAAMEEQAREVAARFEQHRADNTPLLASARRTI